MSNITVTQVACEIRGLEERVAAVLDVVSERDLDQLRKSLHREDVVPVVGQT